MNRTGPRWPAASRAALAVALPALIAYLAGREDAMLMIAGGGFTVIFGEGLPFRTRWRVMATAGTLLVLGSVAGGFVGTVVWAQNDGDPGWWLLLIAAFTTGVAGLAGFAQNALRLPPPGTFFMVMLAGGSTMIAKQDWNPVEAGLWTALGASFAVCVGMMPGILPSRRRAPETASVERFETMVAEYRSATSHTVAETHQVKTQAASTWNTLRHAGLVTGGEQVDDSSPQLVRRCMTAYLSITGFLESTGQDSTGRQAVGTVPLLQPSNRYLIYRSLTLDSHATVTALKIMIASITAGVIGVALGFDRPDWAVVSAMVILQWGPDRRPGTARSIHRLIGSVLGVLLFAVFHLLELDGLSLLVALAACQFVAEIFVVRYYAMTVVAVTPLAMMMGGALQQPLGPGVLARIAEVAIAIACSLVVLWFVLRGADARRAAVQVDNCIQSMGALLGRMMVTRSPEEAQVQRRDLQYELLRERRDAQSAAYNDPRLRLRDEDWWHRHLSVQRTGYDLLDFSASGAGDSLRELDELATRVRSLRAG
ncbi:MAG TPA: FUSC family protein [Candidatus Corynebacterium avicola]|uniref:FUSC family protein n=1 Tax=Candidatus Corynebacterium avicola TaxID=2838527 RepID=A0A9D1UM16_9CORY|nr:FUSC family protein [Candidatus Corynebacterium avicola]